MGGEVRGRIVEGPRVLILVTLLLFGWMAGPFTQFCETSVWAGSPSPLKSTKQAGDPTRGRTVFNGKGVCYYCHGVDGYLDRQPQLQADTAALIAQLNPQPPDLRNPKALRLKTDREQFRAIREGHPGTGMFPDTTMTDQEIFDVLAYLAQLTSEQARRE